MMVITCIGRFSPPTVPKSIRYPSTNETLEIKDHEIVFQLAAKLNELNGGNPQLSVDFIPWIQSSGNAPYYYNGVRNPDGTVPTVSRTTHALTHLLKAARLTNGMWSQGCGSGKQHECTGAAPGVARGPTGDCRCFPESRKAKRISRQYVPGA